MFLKPSVLLETVEVNIAGVKTNCLLDTGSEMTVVSESHFKEHFGDPTGSDSHLKMAWTSLL